MSQAKGFYNQRYSVEEGYAVKVDDLAPYHTEVLNILKELDVDKGDKVVVDAGCGRGIFGEKIASIINVDLSKQAVVSLKSKKSVVGDLCALPIKKGSVEILISVTALEHIPNPEFALMEFDRVLKKGGMAILRPAYFCRWWGNLKLGKKPFNRLNVREKLMWIRMKIEELRPLFLMKWLLQRFYREIERLFSTEPTNLRYYKLIPNYEYDEWWEADADASSCFDAHEILWWFKSRNYEIILSNNLFNRLSIDAAVITAKKAD